MTTILNIDCTGSEAFVAIAKDGILQDVLHNVVQKEHASFLHPALQALLSKLDIQPNQIDAVAVTNGPGSYTGIRIGLAAAKGLCYTLNLPLICINSLVLLASTTKRSTEGKLGVIVPIIDARRMEVFTAVYDTDINELEAPHALLLNSESFNNYLSKEVVIFCGSAIQKFHTICVHKNAHFVDTTDVSAEMCKLSYLKFNQSETSDLVLSNPCYVKEFYEFK